jgi:hypothetical protein
LDSHCRPTQFGNDKDIGLGLIHPLGLRVGVELSDGRLTGK